VEEVVLILGVVSSMTKSHIESFGNGSMKARGSINDDLMLIGIFRQSLGVIETS
jgi:hypothetical protein